MQRRPLIAMGAVAAVIFAVYFASPVNQGTTDPRYTVLLSETLLHRGTFRLDASFQLPLDPARHVVTRESGLPYQVVRSGGAIHYGYPVGSSLLSLPLVWVLNIVGVRTHDADWQFNPAADDFAQLLLAAILCTTTILLLMRMATRRLPLGWSIVLALGLAFGTMFWSTASRGLWNDCWGVLLLALVLDRLISIPDRPLTTAGSLLLATLLAWCFVVRPTYVIPCLAVTVWMACTQPRRLLAFLLCAGGWAGLFFLWSKATHGQWLPPYYQHGSRLAFEGAAQRLAGILLSPSRGLFVFMPTLLWLAVVLVVARRQIADQSLLVLGLAVVLLTLLLNAAWPIWWGGFSYGPRILTGLLPWFALLFVIGISALLAGPPSSRRRGLIATGAVLLFLSVAIHGRGALAKSTWEWNDVPASIDVTQERLWSWTYCQPLAGLFPRPLPTDQRLAMGERSAEPYLGTGWSHAEGAHRWNDGKRAEVVWSGGEFERGRTLVIDGFAFQTPKTPNAPRLQLYWNGKALEEIRFTGECRVTLPPSPSRMINRLEFHFPDAESPAQVSASTDTRLISIAFRSIHFE